MREQLAEQADRLEDEIVQAVAEGATTLREVFLAVGSETLTRYAFFHAINTNRIVLGHDRRLSLGENS